MFSLESPHRGDSNEYTQYTISLYKNENHPKLCQICNYGICSKVLKNWFETAVVNETSVFESLKFYCSVNNMLAEYWSKSKLGMKANLLTKYLKFTH